MDKKVEIVKKSERLRPIKSEVDRLCSSNEKAKKLIKWKPTLDSFKGFEEGLNKTIKWFSRKQNLIQYKSEIYNI